MNTWESKAKEQLDRLRLNFGAREIKCEFEAQGMELAELIRLRTIAQAADLDILLKLGGAEDVWGAKQALLVGVGGIIFPMIESPYAASKSCGVVCDHILPECQDRPHIVFNIETVQAIKHLEGILEEGEKGGLDAVTLGRVDLVGSLGKTRADIDSSAVFDLATTVCKRVKAAGLTMTIGGGIEAESFDFLRRLVIEQSLDCFETRMVVFPAAVAMERDHYQAAVQGAHRFGLLWLEARNVHYGREMTRNNQRLALLRKRVGEAN